MQLFIYTRHYLQKYPDISLSIAWHFAKLALPQGTISTHWGKDKITAISLTFSNAFFNENVWISLIFSPKLVLKVLIGNILALVQLMAWHQPGDKPLSEPMMVSLLMYLWVTRPQWVNAGLMAWTSKIFIDDLAPVPLTIFRSNSKFDQN